MTVNLVKPNVRCFCGHKRDYHKKDAFGYCMAGECFCVRYRTDPKSLARITTCPATGGPHEFTTHEDIINGIHRKTEKCKNCPAARPKRLPNPYTRSRATNSSSSPISKIRVSRPKRATGRVRS